jgi:phospho-N-acetylmuramoyl-pentapeptide-transferase
VPPASPWIITLVSGTVAGVLYAAYRFVIGHWMGQRFRDDGPAHHKEKGYVPTGTGIIMALLLLVGGIIALPGAERGVPGTSLGVYVCWAAALMGLLGFVDDRLKVARGSEGLKARYKLPVQIVVGLVLLYLIGNYFAEWQHVMALTGDPLPWPVYAPWWLYYPVGLFVWLGALNGANFTDGLDGLLSSTTLVVLAGAFLALLDGTEPLALPAAIGFGCLAAFLVYNWKPALIYMGDAGSLAVGALVAGLFLAKGWWLFLGLCVFVWVVNVASVIVQVAVFRLTGKRPLLCSPLHHHFEMAGWGERRIVLAFTGLQLLGCLVAFLWLRYGTHWGLAGTALLLGILALLLIIYHRRAR